MVDDRLEKIIEQYKDDVDVAEYAGITLTLSDYRYIIERARKADELEKQLKESSLEDL